jgi:hypothetical protein
MFENVTTSSMTMMKTQMVDHQIRWLIQISKLLLLFKDVILTDHRLQASSDWPPVGISSSSRVCLFVNTEHRAAIL